MTKVLYRSERGPQDASTWSKVNVVAAMIGEFIESFTDTSYLIQITPRGTVQGGTEHAHLHLFLSDADDDDTAHIKEIVSSFRTDLFFFHNFYLTWVIATNADLVNESTADEDDE